MARIRTIKPEICNSRDFAGLSMEARVFFILLWTHCDDEGRCEFLPRQLLGILFPHDEQWSPAQLRSWVEECEKPRMVTVYRVGSDEFLSVVNWNKHQKINRPTPSRLPPPPNVTDDSVNNAPILTEILPTTHDTLSDSSMGNREASLKNPENALRARKTVDLGPRSIDLGVAAARGRTSFAVAVLTAAAAIQKFAHQKPPEDADMDAAEAQFVGRLGAEWPEELDRFMAYYRPKPPGPNDKPICLALMHWAQSAKQPTTGKPTKLRHGTTDVEEIRARL